jgi:hypothetical protein
LYGYKGGSGVKGILFNTDMVRAILDGRKTQTRRLNGLSEINKNPDDWVFQGTSIHLEPKLCFVAMFRNKETHQWITVKSPYLPSPYEVLYVRETWLKYKEKYYYKADDKHKDLDALLGGKSFFKWRPSVHMPREAARIFLRVTDVQVERAQDITEEDARAEGIQSYWAEPHRDVSPFIGAAKEIGADLCFTRREAFRQLWDSLYAAKGYDWDVNPWVWKYTFERTEKP